MNLWIKADTNSKTSAIATLLNTGSIVADKLYYVVDKVRVNSALVLYFIDERGKVTCADSEGFIGEVHAVNHNPNLDRCVPIPDPGLPTVMPVPTIGFPEVTPVIEPPVAPVEIPVVPTPKPKKA